MTLSLSLQFFRPRSGNPGYLQGLPVLFGQPTATSPLIVNEFVGTPVSNTHFCTLRNFVVSDISSKTLAQFILSISSVYPLCRRPHYSLCHRQSGHVQSRRSVRRKVCVIFILHLQALDAHIDCAHLPLHLLSPFTIPLSILLLRRRIWEGYVSFLCPLGNQWFYRSSVRIRHIFWLFPLI